VTDSRTCQPWRSGSSCPACSAFLRSHTSRLGRAWTRRRSDGRSPLQEGRDAAAQSSLHYRVQLCQLVRHRPGTPRNSVPADRQALVRRTAIVTNDVDNISTIVPARATCTIGNRIPSWKMLVHRVDVGAGDHAGRTSAMVRDIGDEGDKTALCKNDRSVMLMSGRCVPPPLYGPLAETCRRAGFRSGEYLCATPPRRRSSNQDAAALDGLGQLHWPSDQKIAEEPVPPLLDVGEKARLYQGCAHLPETSVSDRAITSREDGSGLHHESPWVSNQIAGGIDRCNPSRRHHGRACPSAPMIAGPAMRSMR